MPVTPRDPEETVVVAVLCPAEWYGDPDSFAQEVAALRTIDPRIEVLVEPYYESHELRSERSRTRDRSLHDRVPPPTPAQRTAFARMHVALTADLPFDAPAHCPHLRWVQAVGAGTAHLQTAGLAEGGIRLTNGGGSNAVAIAEFAIGRLIQEAKRFRELDALQCEHRWDPRYGTQLAGSTLGLIGLGAINRAVATRAKAMDMRVLATRRSATPGSTAPSVDALYPTKSLHQMLSESDAVIAAVPETPETEHLIDRRAISAMKPGAFFVNVGRGSLVDHDALIDALRTGHLRGSALDVVSTEPLPADNPLWDAPNIYVSSHCSSAPAALFRNLHQLFGTNLRHFLAGEPLLNEVDPSKGY